ncbi:efflux RND transporter periplasmic adaptor subunit [Abyssalbus ytuae]|uniref:Efflux RND transporter periplasmic adaptor subunit n=1 Tax=Abyssalbus ytuae TaxID=2926907 RepID=A0A9E6ZRD2_9FLAO|nr:efflux RND transporter periplasmic adaptor subunit [Abyssalbus ytuae]UOB16483.1 efflux RND transporter periplasmic adaptor subunit [Abyssalbus ytuae]
MKNNKILKYIILLGCGIFLGWLIFGTSHQQPQTHNHTETTGKTQLWTCSMHPQIMQPEPGDCPICGMDLIPAASDNEGLSPDQFRLSKNALALANIQTTVVGDRNIENEAIKLSGKISENEEANSVQVSYFSGRIENLFINFTGEEVKKGQLLATIYSPELVAAQQELITASSLKSNQPALYKAVRSKLKLWKLSENQINAIEISGKVKENLPVYATVTGTVTQKLVEQGDYVKQGQTLFKIANLNSVWANFDVYENQIDLFQKGQDIAITTRTYPNKVFNEKISFIDPVLNTGTRTLTLRAELNNKEGLLKPGMFIEGKIKINNNTSSQMLMIPSTAVLWTGKRSVVYIKTMPNEPVFEMREVLLGNKTGEQYEIIEGLNQGDEIVTHGTFTVDAAAQLQGKKSMMNKNEGETTVNHENHSQLNQKYFEINKRVAVPGEFQNQLKNVLDDYLKLKDALVNDNPEASVTNAKKIVESLNKVDMKLLTGSQTHNHWMMLEKEIRSLSTLIIHSQNIEAQRNHFNNLSLYTTNAVEVFGVKETVFSQFCPMANNNKGAYWLSTEKEIFNPYFGEAMLKCGEVVKEIH